MTREQIVGVVQIMQRGWNARDAAALTTVYADDCLVHSPMFGEVRGRAEVDRTYREMFRSFGDWDFQGQDLIIDGDRFAQTFVATAIHSSEMRSRKRHTAGSACRACCCLKCATARSSTSAGSTISRACSCRSAC